MSPQPTDVTISCDSNLNFSSEFLLGAGSFFLGGGGDSVDTQVYKMVQNTSSKSYYETRYTHCLTTDYLTTEPNFL